jgi:hypothetical protein
MPEGEIMSTSIQPVVTIVPEQYDGGASATMLITVTNGNPLSMARLGDDTFQFAFDLPWGASIKPQGQVVVNSPSGAINPSDFSVIHQGGNVVFISVAHPPKPFPPGEGFGIGVDFQAPAAISFGVVTATGPQVSGRLELISPTYTAIAFTAPLSRVGLPGITLMPGPPGTPGAPGAPGAPGPAPDGPNFLQVARLRWYEAAGVQQVALPGPAGALTFDGERVWAALSGRDALASIETATGAVTQIPFAGIPSGQLPGAPFAAMVYDGEKFWISGPSGGPVVRPDGTVMPRWLPPCGPGEMLFDGRSVWVGGTAFDASTPGAVPGGAPAGILATDGAVLWIARRLTSDLWSLPLPAQHLGAPPVPQMLPYPPEALVYEGSHLWVANGGGQNSISKYDRNGNHVATYSVGLSPAALLFDGAHIWVANQGDGTVSKVRARDGASLGTFRTPAAPGPALPPMQAPDSLVFDGINVWVGSRQVNALIRL